MALPVSTATGTGPNASSVTVSKPSGGWNSGNYLVALVTNGNTSMTPPTGWSQLQTDTSVAFINVWLYGIALTSAGPASYTWNGFGNMAAIIAEYAASGVDISSVNGSPFGGSSPATWTAATTTVANDYVALFLTTHGTSATAPTGYTQENAVADPNGGGDYIFDAQQATAGSTGSPSATLSGSDSWVAFLVALKPSGGGGGSAPFPPYPRCGLIQVWDH